MSGEFIPIVPLQAGDDMLEARKVRSLLKAKSTTIQPAFDADNDQDTEFENDSDAEEAASVMSVLEEVSWIGNANCLTIHTNNYTGRRTTEKCNDNLILR